MNNTKIGKITVPNAYSENDEQWMTRGDLAKAAPSTRSNTRARANTTGPTATRTRSPNRISKSKPTSNLKAGSKTGKQGAPKGQIRMIDGSAKRKNAGKPEAIQVSQPDQEGLGKLTEKLGYTFKNMNLAFEALTHSTWFHENQDVGWKDNERFEFLGDAVLGLITSRLLLDKYPDKPEGFLSKLRASVVNESSFARCAKALNLDEIILLGKGEIKSGGREKPGILADAFEALAAAVFIDSGFNAAMEVFGHIMDAAIEEARSGPVDAKTRLQEEMWRILGRLPVYTLLDESGPSHNKFFKVEASDGELLRATGEGRSKKQAEQEAAGKLRTLLEEVKSTK